MSTFTWRIDDADVIREVGGPWDAFARDNGGACLATRVVGTSWRSHVSMELGALYRPLLTRLRAECGTCDLDYRCDSPTAQRHLQMRIEAFDSGDVLFTSTLLQTFPQAPDATMQPELVVMCTSCLQVKESDVWHSIEDTLCRWSLWARCQLPAVSHGFFPGCFAQLRQGLA